MSDEEWKNFPVIDGRKFSKYEVSSLGRRRNKKSGHVFSDNPNVGGYIRNEYSDDEGNFKHLSAHNVVARAFLGDPDSGDLTPDHINRDRADNRVVNLRWATAKEQAANSDNSKCKPRGQPIIQYSMKMEELRRWINILTAAKELDIPKSSIAYACRGKLSQAGGFKWAYERKYMDGEIWKEHESLNIQVSNMGRIKPRHCHIIYGSKTTQGYLKYGNPSKLVHIIVAESFLPNPENKPEVNHKDKDGTNNKVENLEWATRSEQMIHSHKNSNPDRYNKTARAVKQYDLEGSFICEYRSIKEASIQTGCSVSGISWVCSGRRESAKGFVFKYSNEDVLNRPALKCPNKIDHVDERGNVINTYNSVKEAANDLGISCKSIYKVLCGETKKTKDGYRFRHN